MHQRQVAARGVAFARGEDEPLGGARRIGMGNAGGELRDFPAAAIAMDRRRVGGPRPAQPQPRRLQAEDIVSGKIGKHFHSGPARGSATRGPKTTKEMRRPHPLHKRFGLPDILEGLSPSCSRGILETVRGGCRRGGDLVASPPFIRPLFARPPLRIGDRCLYIRTPRRRRRWRTTYDRFPCRHCGRDGISCRADAR